MIRARISLLVWLVAVAFGAGIAPSISHAQCQPAMTFTGETKFDNFGSSVSDAGDVDGDGYSDLIVGAARSEGGEPYAGRAYVYSGQTEELLYTFIGETLYSYLGGSVSGAGDVDNDGYADLIVGAIFAGGVRSGQAYVYSGQTGTILYSPIGRREGDLFGASVAGTGDVDNDGYADFIVGAPWHYEGAPRTGRVYVHSGQTGTLLYVFTGEVAEAEFGASVAGAGDVDMDGYDDLIVGANGSGTDESIAGHAYVYSGQTGALVYSYTGEAAIDSFGTSVSGAGDVNNDGYADLIVGASGNDAGGQDAGRAYVYSGQTGALLYTLTGEWAGDRFGISVSGIGDVNHDGYADLIVGARGSNRGGPDAGRVYVYSGQTGRRLYAFNGEAAYDFFGWSVSGAGDVDGDGYPDLIAGAIRNDAGGMWSGRAYVYLLGKNDNTPPNIACPDDITVPSFADLPECDPAQAFALDECGADVQVRCERQNVSGVGCTDTPIPVSYVFTATDPAGNTSSCTWVVTVEQPDCPVPVYLTGADDPAGCACDCHADPQCDALTTVLDVVSAVNIAFRNDAPIPDPNANCPNVTTDVNCDDVTNIIDVAKIVNVAFRNEPPASQFCDACAP